MLLDVADLAPNADPKHIKYSIYKTSDNTVTTFLDTTDTVRGMGINGNKIVWSDNRNGNYDIFMYDIFTSQTTTICNNPLDQENPDVYGDYVVWCDHRNDYNNDNLNANPPVRDHDLGDIYGYKISTGNEFPVDVSVGKTSIFPKISGTIATWHMSVCGSVMQQATIMVADLSLSQINPLPASTQISHKYPPLINGDLIIWVDMRQYKLGKINIYGYKISTGTEIQLTNGNGRDRIEWLSFPYLVYNHNDDVTNINGRGDLHLIKIE